MARKRDRIFASVLALTFLISSVAFTGILLWTSFKDNNKPEEETALIDENQPTLQGTKLDNFTPVKSVGELEITDITEGEGEVVQKTSVVTVHYTGALAKTGVIFQSSLDFGQPVSFGLDQVIKGWGEGVPGMKVGGTRRLLIPADKAYGAESPSADIPANSDLVFDITLVSIK